MATQNLLEQIKESLDCLEPLEDFFRFRCLWPISQIWGREFVPICPQRHRKESHGSFFWRAGTAGTIFQLISYGLLSRMPKSNWWEDALNRP
jgi:hypothetical protein